MEGRGGQAQPRRDGRLEGRPGGVGQPLLDPGDRGEQLLARGDPADLPARHREGLARRGDRDGAVLRAGQGRDRQMRRSEGEVLVDLVGDDQGVVPGGLLDDRLQGAHPQHQPGGVVRGVHQHQAGALRECGPQLRLVDVEHQVPGGAVGAGGQRHRAVHPAGQRDHRRVLVVERLEGEHLVSWLHQGEDRRRERLGGARAHQHLARGIPAQPVPRGLVLRDRLAQHCLPGAGRVLVLPATDRRDGGLGHRLRRCVVGIALTEVQRAVLGGARRHLCEHGGAGHAVLQQAGSGGGTGPGAGDLHAQSLSESDARSPAPFSGSSAAARSR